MPPDSLKKKAISSMLWSSIEVFASKGLQFFVTVILARLLTPEDFGLVALLLTFVLLAEIFVDAGFGQALIQRRELTPQEESSVFFFNVIVASLLSAILFLLSPVIAEFFSQPMLRPLLLAGGLAIFIGSLSAVQVNLLVRELRFDTLMKIGVTASIGAGAVAVVMAYAGYGVWSLVAQILVRSTISCALAWLLSAWRPSAGFRLQALRPLFEFGGFMMLTALLNVIHIRMHTVLLGKLFSLHELGLFSQGLTTRDVILQSFNKITTRVLFPVLSNIGDDRRRLRVATRKALQTFMFLLLPVMLGMSAVAELFVVTAYGKKWEEAGQILSVLCLAGATWPLQTVNQNVLKALGHSRRFFQLAIIKKTFAISALLFAAPFGLLAIAWSQVAAALFAFVVNSYYTKRLIDYGPLRQLADIGPSLGLSVAMLGAVFVVKLNIDLVVWRALALLVLTGALTYGGGAIILKLPIARELHDVGRKLSSRRE